MALDLVSPQAKLAMKVAGLLHSDDYYGAARAVKEWVSEINPELKDSPVNTKSEATVLLYLLLQWLLDNNGHELAAQMLWSPTQFTPLPQATKDVWKAFDEDSFILFMGAASQSKSFSVGVKLLLEFVRDPEDTTIKVIGPSEQHLSDNLFSHLVSLHRSSTIPLPGEIGSLFIGLNMRSRKSSISGVVIPVGKKSAGRLQGVKRHNRKTPHPVFGPLSRLYIFADEISNISQGLWGDFDNLFSNVSDVGDRGLKVMGAFNPSGTTGDNVGVRAEPPQGWQNFDMDRDFRWVSKRGWTVVRLDATRSENIIQRRVIFPGLQTYEGMLQIIKNSGGTNSPGFFSMIRACYPPMGTVLSLIPQGMLNDVKGVPTWYSPPRAVGGVDLALEGADSARFASGEFGLATSMTYPPSLAHPSGRTVIFKDEKGRNRPKYLLYLKQIFPLPSGDTVAMTESIIKLARALGIAPEYLCLDRTGNGAGVHDLIMHQWSAAVIGVNYSEGASESKILVEDSDTAKNLYDRAATELWFATRKFLEFNYLKMSPTIETGELFPQLTSRLYRASGKKATIESKVDYRSRFSGHSPDDADSLTLLVHAVRKGSGVVFGMDVESTTDNSEDDDDGWFSGPRISSENRFQDLDSP